MKSLPTSSELRVSSEFAQSCCWIIRIMKSGAARSGTWDVLILVILTLIWLMGIPFLFMQGVAAGLEGSLGNFPDGDRARRFLIAAAVAGVTAPTLAAIVAERARRRAATLTFGVVAALCLLTVVTMVAIEKREANTVPSPEPMPPGRCIERSGGDNDCPGG